MKAFRTPWWYYIIGFLIGFICGVLLMLATESSTLMFMGAPWLVYVLMIAVGVITFVLAWQTHQYTTARPEERSMPNPQRAVLALMMSKSLAMAGAILTGWYLGQVCMSLAHLDVVLYANVLRECVIAATICLIDMIVGIVGEWLCQLPPEDGPEKHSTNFTHVSSKVDRASSAASRISYEDQ